LINITGIDGCGKGTQLQHLADYLTQKRRKIFLSKAYGPREKEMFSLFIERAHDLTVMFLFQAMHVEQRMKAEKALQDGAIVLADRWDDAYFAYHSQYGMLADDAILRDKLNELAFGGIKPDVTFLLKVPVSVGMERCRLRGADFFDLKSAAHHQSKADYLDKMAAEHGWTVIDGERPHREIHEEIVSSVQPLIGTDEFHGGGH